MGSFAAELRLGTHVYPVIRYHYAFTQSTDSRGRVNAKVRHGRLELEMDVPRDDVLPAWAADPHKTLKGVLVTLDDQGRVTEHVTFATGYCVLYREVFNSGDITTGSYRCEVHISDPAGFTYGIGAPGSAFVVPAAREHGTPPVATTGAVLPLPGTVSTCPPDVTARLQMQVELACNTKGLSSRCTKFDSCPVLLEKIVVARACIAARRTIMIQCFGGGDDIHKEQVADRERGISRCKENYERRCGPLPEPAPDPQPAPSSEPSKKKEDDKFGPTTLTGVALLLFLILRAVLNPVPN